MMTTRRLGLWYGPMKSHALYSGLSTPSTVTADYGRASSVDYGRSVALGGGWSFQRNLPHSEQLAIISVE